MLVLKNCRLVRELTEGYDEEYANVLIDGKIIVDIKPVSECFNETFECVDLEGKTLLPGLIDLHAHLCCRDSNYLKLLTEEVGTQIFNHYAFAKAFAQAGYTTVRDCGGIYNAANTVSEAIKAGIVQGPRIISSGQIITPTETGNETFGGMYVEADGVDEVRKAAREQLKRGNDFIKYMVTGAFLNDKGDPGQLITTVAEVRAAVEAAELKGTYVAAHCHSDLGIRTAIEAGVRTIEHAVFITEETVERLQNKRDIFVVPTGAVSMNCVADDNELITPDALAKNKLYEQTEKQAINMAYQAGLKLGFGSDLDMESFLRVPGYEFIARKQFYSFRDLDILLQATKNNAEIAGLDKEIGTIKKGKLADLAVIDGKPDQDIFVMKKKPCLVFAEGKRINQEI